MEEELRTQWIELLQEDLSGEYAALLQYLHHAFGFPPGEMEVDRAGAARDFRSLALAHAIDEMRHAEQLARTIVRLGGTPTNRVAAMNVGGTYGEMARNDLSAEEAAIREYSSHRDAIADPEARLLLSNIIRDEERHRDTNRTMVEELLKRQLAPDRPVAARPAGRAAQDVEELRQCMNLELRSIWAHAYQSLLLGFDQSVAPRLRAAAIRAMGHWRGLAEQVQRMGGAPDIPLNPSSMGSVAATLEAALREMADLRKQVVSRYDDDSRNLAHAVARGFVGGLLPGEKETLEEAEGWLASLPAGEPAALR